MDKKMNVIAFQLSLLFIFLIPWETAITIRYLGTLTRVTGMLTSVAWIGAIVISNRPIRKPHIFHFTVLLYLLWNFSSFFWSINPDQTFQRVITYTQLIIMAYILWDLYNSPKALLAGMLAYIYGAYITIGSTIFNYITGYGNDLYGIGRYAGAGLNAVEQSVILTFGLPISWHIATSTTFGIKNRALKISCYMYIPTSILATLLTASRTGLITIIIGILYILSTSIRLKFIARLIIFIFFITSITTIVHYIPEPTISRLATFYDSIAEGDLGGRMMLWRNSLEVFEKNPILGVGSGSLRATEEVGAAAHNTIFSIMAETGLIGLSLFIFIFLVIVFLSFDQPKQFSTLWITVLSIWVIGISSLTWEYTKSTWLFFSLILISSKMAHDKQSKDFI